MIVPAPLDCIFISDDVLVNSKLSPVRAKYDAPDCTISKAFNCKETPLIDTVAFPPMLNAVLHFPHAPPSAITFAPAPVTLIPVFAVGSSIVAAPKNEQSSISARLSLIFRPVVLIIKRHALKPYSCVSPPEHSTPVKKFTNRQLVIVEKVPAVIEIPVARGEEDSKAISAIRMVLLIKRRSCAGVDGIMITAEEEIPTIEIPSAVMARAPALLSSV